MPVYEFACGACDSKFERLLSFDVVESGVSCPRCGAGRARRLLSTFAAVSKSSSGETSTFAGGDSACSTGGGCRCACAH